jgi:hypothetical protein
MNMYQAPAAGYGPVLPQFRSLGWRSIAASICIGAFVGFNLLLEVVQMSVGDELEGPDPNIAASVVVLFVALAQLGSLLLSIIFFGIWIHCAASNLRGLGRQALQYTPGWAIGWFFVPFANLVKVPQVMLEVWRASTPTAPSFGWQSSPATPLIPLWWGMWIFANVLARISTSVKNPTTSGEIGAMGALVAGVAGALIIVLMRSISSRQDQASRALTTA